MNNSEILQAAIEKAIKNGWNSSKRLLLDGNDVWHEICCDCGDLAITLVSSNESSDPWIYYHSLEEIIFNHDFAKAFWGEEQVCMTCRKSCEEVYCMVSDHYTKGFLWQCHLQQMVLEEEPLQYLKKFLGKETLEHMEE